MKHNDLRYKFYECMLIAATVAVGLIVFSHIATTHSIDVGVNNTAYADDPVPPAPQPAPQPAQPKIVIPKDLQGVVGQFIEVPATTNGTQVKWVVLNQQGLNLFPMDLLKDTKTAVAVASTDGIYYLHAWTALNDIPSDLATCKITIGNPPTPVPPGPNPPQPNPPQPTPTVSKLSVLFVDENSNYGTASYKSYEGIVNSIALRTWLAAHCSTDSSTNISNWRKWDQNTDISNESNPVWKTLMTEGQKNSSSLPWLVVANDKGEVVSSTAVPSSLADTLALLQKFGGK